MPPRKKPVKKPMKFKFPLWTWDSGLSQTALNTFLDCPEQFALKYVEGVTANRLNIPIEFGNLFHMMCEFQEKDTPQRIAAKCGVAYLQSRARSVSADQREELDRMVNVCQLIFPHYCTYWQSRDKDRRWIASEGIFKVPYYFSVDMIQAQDKLIHLTGRRDKVYRDTKGRLCLKETKTKSEINEAAIRDSLRADFQSLFYLLSMKLEYKEEPAEVLYDVVRRPGQKFGKRDTLQSFLERIDEDIRSRPDHYFARWQVQLMKGTLDSFRQSTLDPALRRFLQWWRSVQDHPFDRFKSPYHLLNLSALYNRRHGRSDLYEWVINRNTSNYFIRKDVHPELSESIQLSKV